MSNRRTRRRSGNTTVKRNTAGSAGRNASISAAGNKRRPVRRTTVVDLLFSADAKKYFIAAAAVLAATIVAVIILTAVHFSTNINGIEISIDGNPIGVIKGVTATANDIYNKALMKLESDKGPVIVNEKITEKRVHAKKFVDESYVIGVVYNRFTYKVLAAVIIVDGEDTVILKTGEEADGVLNEIKNEYYLEGALSVGFVEQVTVEERYVDNDEVKTAEKAKSILTADKREEVTYTVKQGDTLWGIALDNAMAYDDIFRFNPDLDPDPSKLKVGTEIVVERSVPFISVVTVRRETYEETNERSDKYVIVDEITRVNGIETDRRNIDRNLIE